MIIGLPSSGWEISGNVEPGESGVWKGTELSNIMILETSESQHYFETILQHSSQKLLNKRPFKVNVIFLKKMHTQTLLFKRKDSNTLVAATAQAIF